MEEDEVALINTCSNLVSLRSHEAFPVRLLGTKPGEWVGVRDFCEKIGVPAGDLGSDIFAAWLPDPLKNDAYAVILFHDDESKWSMTAQYNRARLSGSGPQSQKVPISNPISSGLPAQETAPVA